jgi:uncharacterized membrane protein YiaA
MAKKSKTKTEEENKSQQYQNEPWLSMRTGFIVITIVSIGMAVLTAWNAVQTQGLLNGILWGLAYGAGIWGVFAVALLFNRFIRGKRN